MELTIEQRKIILENAISRWKARAHENNEFFQTFRITNDDAWFAAWCPSTDKVEWFCLDFCTQDDLDLALWINEDSAWEKFHDIYEDETLSYLCEI